MHMAENDIMHSAQKRNESAEIKTSHRNQKNDISEFVDVVIDINVIMMIQGET